MIIKELFGDVTAPTVGIIGHGVNCQGVMGSGVALTIRNKFPQAYEAYIEHCRDFLKDSEPYELLGTVQLVQVADDLYIANMFTQVGFGKDGKQYASLDGVRGACMELSAKRDALIVQEQAELIERIYHRSVSIVAAGQSDHVDIDCPRGSARSEKMLSTVRQLVLSYHDVHEGDDVSASYALPIYLPLIGCGLGGLEWPIVKNAINQYTGVAPVTIYHYQK